MATKVSSYLLPAMLCLGALVQLPAVADTMVNTYPGWNGSDTIGSFGYPNTSTYSEVVEAPAGTSVLTSLSFWLEAPVGFEFQVFVAPWDNTNYELSGAMESLSSVITSTNPSLVQYSVSGLSDSVTAGDYYVLGLTIDNVYAADSTVGVSVLGGDIFAGGNTTDYFAWANNSGVGSELFADWNNTGCADNTGACGQAAFQVDFNGGAVPEPSSIILLITAIGLIAVGYRRRQLS